MRLFACIIASALAVVSAGAVQQGKLRGNLRDSAANTPQIPRWGGNIDTFEWRALVNMTDPADAPIRPNWLFKYFYNGAKNVSRFEHGPGNGDEMCNQAKLHTPGHPCTVINALDGKLYVEWAGTGNCCLWGDALTIRSDWMLDGGTTYMGNITFHGENAQEWLKYGSFANHYLCTDDARQAPISFVEHKGPLLKEWDFMRWIPGPQSDALFEPPAGQCAASCK